MTTKKTTAFKAIEGATAIAKAITSISTRGKSLDKDVHIAAVSCLIHADKHGDVTLATKLVAALPNSSRKNALRDWFLAFGKFTWDTENKQFAYNKAATTLTNEAIAMPFWEFKPEPEYKPFDINAAIQQVISRATKAQEKGETVPKETLAKLQTLVQVEVSH